MVVGHTPHEGYKKILDPGRLGRLVRSFQSDHDPVVKDRCRNLSDQRRRIDDRPHGFGGYLDILHGRAGQNGRHCRSLSFDSTGSEGRLGHICMVMTD